MIITKKKSDEEIDAMIAPFSKLFVVGCGTCATKCMSGGEEQVKELMNMVDKLKNKLAQILDGLPPEVLNEVIDLKKLEKAKEKK